MNHCFEIVNDLKLQVVNKGMTSYRDPESSSGRGQKTLHIKSYDTDLTRIFAKAVRESSKDKHPEGATIRAVERHIRSTYIVEVKTIIINFIFTKPRSKLFLCFLFVG